MLVDKVVEAFPSYRTTLISNVRNPKLWQSDKFFAIGKKMVLPTETDLKSDPWSGFKLYSYSGDGEVSSHFHYLLRGLNNSPRLDDLRKSVEEYVAQNPGWYAGAAMIALIDMQQGKKDEARAKLQQLVAREEVQKGMPYDAGWLIAQELDKFQETRELALSLYEKAMSNDSAITSLSILPVRNSSKVTSPTGVATMQKPCWLSHAECASELIATRLQRISTSEKLTDSRESFP